MLVVKYRAVIKLVLGAVRTHEVFSADMVATFDLSNVASNCSFEMRMKHFGGANLTASQHCA